MGVRDRREDAETRRSSPLRLLIVLLLAGCTPPETPKQPTISLRMTGTPPDATVVIDDEVVGTLDFVVAHGVALPPGVHHVTVTASGYFPRDQEVEARPSSPPIRVDVSLQPVPD
jgi:hypothetical protein